MSTPGMPVPPEVPLGPDGQPLDQGAGSPQLQGPPAPKYGFLGRLLGAKHGEEMRSKHEYSKFLMEQIDKAMNEKDNRMPPEALDHFIGELSKTLGHEGGIPASEIKKRLQTGVQMKQAAKTLAQMQSSTTPQPMGTPAMSPQGQAPPAQASPPPGIPKPPFDPGASAGGPTPVQGESPVVAESSALSGAGDGIPPPIPVRPVPAPSRNRLSRAELGAEQGAQELAAKQPAALLAMRMQEMLIEQGRKMGLEGPMLADWVNKHAISGGTALSPGQVLTQTGSGKVLAAGAPRITTMAPGSQALVTPTPGPGMPPPPEGQAPPQSGSTTIPGPPPLLAPDQRAANAQWEAKHGLPTPPDKYGEAMAEYKEASVTPSAREMQRQRIANFAELKQSRQLAQAHLAQTIREFELTKGHAAIESLADQVHENPDLFQKLSGDVMNAVAQRFNAKYHLPAPRPLPGDMKNKEDGSIISLNHVAALTQLLANPVIQKRMGSWNGRVGDIEQAVGSTVGLSPADARAIQDFRTRITYLFAQEGKAVFGGRPPQKLMDDLKKSSPNMKMGLPLFQGALDAVKGMGELNIKSTDDYRFNKRSITPPPGAPKSAEEYLKSVGH